MVSLSAIAAPYAPIWFEYFNKGMDHQLIVGDVVSGANGTLEKVKNALVAIALMYAVVFFVIGSYQITTGSQESVNAGKKRLVRSGAGVAVAIGAYALGTFVQNASKQSFG